MNVPRFTKHLHRILSSLLLMVSMMSGCVATQRQPLSTVVEADEFARRLPDLYDQSFQWLVQSYFDSKAGFPPAGHDDEYSAYFEAYLPDEKDRRRFLDARLQSCKPSYGQELREGTRAQGLLGKSNAKHFRLNLVFNPQVRDQGKRRAVRAEGAGQLI